MAEAALRKKQSYLACFLTILLDPRRFFMELSGNIAPVRSLGFAMVGSLVFAVGSLLTNAYPNPMFMGWVLFSNAMGMMFISLCLGYLIMVMIMGKHVTFGRLTCVYAVSAGVTLMFSWVFQFLWFTETWKWWLVYMGLRNTCGFSKKQGVMVIVLSFAVEYFFLYAVCLAFMR
jgi:hypothetical protein